MSSGINPVTPKELREWREARGFSRARLAQLLNGTCESSVRNWEMSRCTPPPCLRQALQYLSRKHPVK